jgi:hypothetical protein
MGAPLFHAEDATHEFAVGAQTRIAAPLDPARKRVRNGSNCFLPAV